MSLLLRDGSTMRQIFQLQRAVQGSSGGVSQWVLLKNIVWWVTVVSQQSLSLVDGHWGSICNKEWTNKNSEVICRQLHLTGGYVLVNDVGKGSGPVWLDQVQCVENETNVEDCKHGQWGAIQPECESHQTDVGVVCGKIYVYLDRTSTC